MNKGLTRRQLMQGLAASTAVPTLGLLGGCSSQSLQLLGSSFAGARTAVSGDRYGLSDDQIEALPYASLGVRIGRLAPAVLILASIDQDELRWASADRVVLVTRRGRLVKSVGLARDLLGTQWASPDPLLGFPNTIPASTESRVGRFVDLRPKDDFGVAVESRYDTIGNETLTLLGRTRRTVVLRERISVRKWRWSGENLFWLDAASGKVWKSRQQFCPDVPPLTLEVLKPAEEPPLST